MQLPGDQPISGLQSNRRNVIDVTYTDSVRNGKTYTRRLFIMLEGSINLDHIDASPDIRYSRSGTNTVDNCAGF